MRFAFQIRLFFIVSTPFLILTIFLLFVIREYSQKYIEEIIYDEMKAKAEILNELFLNSDEKKLIESIDQLNKKFKINYRITIIDRDGKVIVDSKSEASSMENLKDGDEFIRALSGEIGYTRRHSKILDDDMANLAIPIIKDDTIIGAIRVSMPQNEFLQKVNRLNSPILIYGIISIFLFYILIFLIASRVFKPIDEMIYVSQRFQMGDYSARLLLPSTKEYEFLYNTFNNMLEKIQRLLEQNQNHTNELNSIISSIREGIIIINRKFEILLANNGFFEAICQEFNNNIKGKKLFEIIKNSDLNNIINQSFENKKGYIEEIEIDYRYYLISSSYNKPGDIVIILFYNITDLKKFKLYKKELISNVSHELKTPLTAINGFIDTLNDEITDETHKRYLNIIKNHTQRMINIVNDLLTLSSLESGLQLEFTECNINNIINDILLMFNDRLNEKKLSLNLKLESKSILYCDRLKIEQALINLIDNAIKYTDTGSITISTYDEEENIVIEVEDTGIGIEPKDIERIFERFYVANKSRSRALGGTGLGLSIVKHIVNRHNGDVYVVSEVNKGSKFTVRLPKNLTKS